MPEPKRKRTEHGSSAAEKPLKARKKSSSGPAGSSASAPGAHPAGKALIVDDDPGVREAVSRALRGANLDCHAVGSAAAARAVLRHAEFDVALIDIGLPDGGGLDLARELAEGSGGARPGPRPVMITGRPTLEHAVEAMRVGAADLIAKPFDAPDLAERALAAVRSARRERERSEQITRLKRACKRLSAARQHIARQVDSLCNDLADAYQELADQMSQVTLASEFSTLVRQELDVESLLRTSLEFILARTGPTNAAVFLPGTGDDYSLGAYVNYDCPKDSADVLLDHLADILPPEFERDDAVHVFTEDAALERRIGDDAHWLADRQVVIFACRHEGECLAVAALFRDRRSPFPQDLPLQLRVIADIFAQQLSRVIRIHHRHKPGGIFDFGDDADSGGLAA